MNFWAVSDVEAAKLDGCTGFGLVWRILIPMLMPYVVIATLLAVVNGFKVFDQIWVMTITEANRLMPNVA